MKTSALLSLSVLLFTTTQLSAQINLKQQRHLGGSDYDYVTTMSIAKDGSAFIAGISSSDKSGDKSENSRGGNDYWVIKAISNKANGTVKKVWNKTVGSVADDYLRTVLATSDGGCLLAGATSAGISGDKTDSGGVWIVKLDKDGNLQWQKSIQLPSGERLSRFTDIDSLPDGGYILSLSEGGLMRTDAAFNVLWRYPAYSDDNLAYNSVRRTSDGGYIVSVFDNDDFVYLVKTDSSGIQQWSLKRGPGIPEVDQNYAGSSTDPHAIQTMDGGYALFFTFSYYNFYEGDEEDVTYESQVGRYLYKTDKNGMLLWSIVEPTKDGYYSEPGLAQSKDGDYLFGGTKSSNGNQVLDIDKVDKTGHKLWETSVPCKGFTNSIVRIAANSYLFGGGERVGTNNNLSNYDFYLAAITDTSHTTPVVRLAATAKQITAIQAAAFTAYPNPVKDRLFVQNAGTANFIITDENGRTILSKKITDKGEIDVSRLTAGVYYLKNTATGLSQKIMVIK